MQNEVWPSFGMGKLFRYHDPIHKTVRSVGSENTLVKNPCTRNMSRRGPISYPKSSGSLASGWLPGEALGYWNFITALLLPPHIFVLLSPHFPRNQTSENAKNPTGTLATQARQRPTTALSLVLVSGMTKMAETKWREN